MRENLKAFFRAVADFFASMGAKYKLYVERENAKVRAEAKANAVAMAEQCMLTDYHLVADIVATANNNLVVADPNVLRPVNDFSQIFNNRPICVRRTANGRDVFGWCFRLRRSRGCSAAASTLKRELQAEVNAVATAYGYPPLCVDVRYREDNVVGVFVVPAYALREDVSDARP